MSEGSPRSGNIENVKSPIFNTVLGGRFSFFIAFFVIQFKHEYLFKKIYR